MPSPAPALRELQRQFLDALLGCPEDPAAPPDLAAVLQPATRFGIYADMYFWRLRDVLAEDFPTLAAVLGDEAFTDLVRGYLRAHPSRYASVRHAGRHLAEHLGPGWAGDLARLEWARVDAFDAPDAPPLTRADLQALLPDAWPDLRLTGVPSLAIVESAWAIHRAWDDPTAPVQAVPTAVRVWRRDDVVWHAPMAPDEARALGLLLSGACFGAVCEALEDPAEAAGLLARWLDDGVFAGIPR